MRLRRRVPIGSSAVRDAVVLAGFALALLLPSLGLAASHIDDVTGEYRGFSQSNLDPRNHPFMKLTVTRQDGPDFFGLVEIGGARRSAGRVQGEIVEPGRQL